MAFRSGKKANRDERINDKEISIHFHELSIRLRLFPFCVCVCVNCNQNFSGNYWKQMIDFILNAQRYGNNISNLDFFSAYSVISKGFLEIGDAQHLYTLSISFKWKLQFYGKSLHSVQIIRTQYSNINHSKQIQRRRITTNFRQTDAKSP